MGDVERAYALAEHWVVLNGRAHTERGSGTSSG